MNDSERCETCRFWWRFVDSNEGCCQRYPPVPVCVDRVVSTHWPDTVGWRQCGEWQAKKEAIQEPSELKTLPFPWRDASVRLRTVIARSLREAHRDGPMRESRRLYNFHVIRNGHIVTPDLITEITCDDMIAFGREKFEDIKNIGRITIEEIKSILTDCGYDTKQW